MKNPPKELNIMQLSETFGIGLTANAKVVLVQLEDGKITDLVETSSGELLRAHALVQDTLQKAAIIMMEANTKPN